MDISRTNRWTIEAWVNPFSFGASGSYPTIYAEGYWGASLGLNAGTGKLESWINNANRLIGTVALSLNQWSHVALVYDGTNRIFYVNGAVAGSGSAPATVGDNGGSAIGDVAPTYAAAHFGGLIDEVSLYKRALSASEIQSIFAAGSFGKCKPVTPPPDLAVATNISWTGSPIVGQTISVSWTVTNTGPGVAVGTWHDTVVLSTNATANGAVPGATLDLLLNRTVAAGGSYSVTGSVVLPGSIVNGGQYYLVATADSQNWLPESTKTNNSQALPFTLIPISNDTCAGAIPMTPGATYSQNNQYATSTGDPTASWANNLYRGVWYTVATTKNQRVNLTTCASDFDTRMAIYTGSCGALTEVAGNDNYGPYCGCGGCQASISFISSSAPTTYYILAGAAGPAINAPSSATTLRILLDLQDPPAIDTCAGAVALVPGVTHTVNNIFYATELGDPNTSWASSIYRGVWYTLTPPAGARLTISTCGSDFDTRMAIYRGNCGTLIEVTGNDNNGPACGGSQASVNFYDVGGQNYYILVGANSPTGNSPAANTTLRIVATVSPPANDTCTGILPLAPGAVSVVNTLNATEAGDPTNTCIPGLRGGVWFAFNERCEWAGGHRHLRQRLRRGTGALLRHLRQPRA